MKDASLLNQNIQTISKSTFVNEEGILPLELSEETISPIKKGTYYQ